MAASLTDLNILALDCQATGANPEKGHILEIGWVKTCAAGIENPPVLNVDSYLINLPPETEIPRSVKRITGISEDALSAAISVRQTWSKLVKAACEVAAANHFASCPTVIHFARFEEPFLKALYKKNNAHAKFPFQIICTHAISKRLLPALPRRGLRAMAGYFEYSMPEFRRSADHAIATAVIWKNIVGLLKADWGVTTLDHLLDWLKSTTPASNTDRFYPMDPKTRLGLPDKPGIYRMLRSNGDLLYVGKAKSLKQRVNTYFRRTGSHAEHILEMLTQARRLNFTLTGSALEAAILESDEIKQYSPPYNIALRTGQRSLVFFSKNLKQQSGDADENHPIGPLPSGNLIEALAAFASLLANGPHKEDKGLPGLAYSMFGQPAAYAPDVDCVCEGLGLFNQRHSMVFNPHCPLRTLTGLGARLWRERLEALELDEPDGMGLGESVEKQQAALGNHVWTPEAVAGAIESIVRRGAHLIRRSRWFCLLSESTLAWQSQSAESDNKMMIVLEGGAVVQREDLEKNKRPPTPPGHAKRFQKRQQNLDLMIYDRLRVVTTELRRLVSEGRNIELRLGPKVILQNRQLQKVLRWV